KCLPCNESEFTEYPNDFSKCLRCQVCREDQVQLSPCQATRNTQCACRNGTFCSPDHPCEMCQKCRPRCPSGEVELAACTPHSDRRCGPPTTTSSSSSNQFLIIGGVVLFVLFLLLLFLLWRCCCQSSGEHQNGHCRTLSFQVRVPRTATIQRSILVPAEGHDPVKGKGLGAVLGGWEGTNLQDEGFFGQSPFRPSSPCPTLSFPLPLPLALRCSFDIFADMVPVKGWKRYGRALDLLENDIDLAEMNDKWSRETFFQMLNTWHNKKGMNASVNTLLATLHQISLGGIAEEISSKLVQEGLFQYEES
ncbi:TR10B factor, partial [Ramphastos sulfuratus]|nr:TR10B factor [Ramphastos sulfuratus]